MSLKETIQKITALKGLIQALEGNCENRFYYTDKKYESIKRSDAKIEEIIQINKEEKFQVKSRDKTYYLSVNTIKYCPFKNILTEKLEKGSMEAFIDIGAKYIKYALELLRKSFLQSQLLFKRKVCLLIYPKDKIEPNVFSDFIREFFIFKSDKDFKENVEILYIPKKEKYVYSAPSQPINFLKESEVEHLVKKNTKQQLNKEKKQNVESKEHVIKNSFFENKNDEEVDYFASIYTENL